tara:strand:- start:376 stop:588 length:213 start_codon:yes stop_codon:yes gene_type:complete
MPDKYHQPHPGLQSTSKIQLSSPRLYTPEQMDTTQDGELDRLGRYSTNMLHQFFPLTYPLEKNISLTEKN